MAEPKPVSYLNPEALAAPLGAYSHLGIAPAGRLVAVAGQVGIDAEGRVAGEDDCGAQTEQAFANVAAALGEVGLAPDAILQMITYLVRPEDIERFFAARARVFGRMYRDGQYPPNTLLVVQRLVQPELLVEIQAVAVDRP